MAAMESRFPTPNPVSLAFSVAQLQGGGYRTPASMGAVPQLSGTDVLADRTLADTLMTFQEYSSSDCGARTPTSINSKQNVGSEDGIDAEEKLARNRERNREHARKTRLRKKAHLEALQSKAKGLEAERQVLKQQIEECSIASILLGLSSGSEFDEPADDLLGDDSTANALSSSDMAFLSGGGRNRFRLETADKRFQPLTLNIDGQFTLVGGGKTHVNWKTGSFQDEDGNQRRLTEDQLEHLRRERNRLHAKMTRDRKKCFIAKVEKTIEELESDIERVRGVLRKVSQHQMVTPAASPELQPLPSPPIEHEDTDTSDFSSSNHTEIPSPKRFRRDFSLIG